MRGRHFIWISFRRQLSRCFFAVVGPAAPRCGRMWKCRREWRVDVENKSIPTGKVTFFYIVKRLNCEGGGSPTALKQIPLNSCHLWVVVGRFVCDVCVRFYCIVLSGTYVNVCCCCAVHCCGVPSQQHKDPAVHGGLLLFFVAFLSIFLPIFLSPSLIHPFRLSYL